MTEDIKMNVTKKPQNSIAYYLTHYSLTYWPIQSYTGAKLECKILNIDAVSLFDKINHYNSL